MYQLILLIGVVYIYLFGPYAEFESKTILVFNIITKFEPKINSFFMEGLTAALIC